MSRLLLDANLSPKLVARISELFPGSLHIFHAGLERSASDEDVWHYARENRFVIMTADLDFVHLANERGAPPQIIRLENCNFRTSEVEALIRRNTVRITEFTSSNRAILLVRQTG